jgi:hypothetical protein
MPDTGYAQLPAKIGRGREVAHLTGHINIGVWQGLVLITGGRILSAPKDVFVGINAAKLRKLAAVQWSLCGGYAPQRPLSSKQCVDVTAIRYALGSKRQWLHADDRVPDVAFVFGREIET